MKEKKINFMVLILVVLIMLIIGIGIGYLLFNVMNVQKGIKDETKGLIANADNTKNVENNSVNIDNKLNITNSNNVVEIPQYDAEKTIFANGQSYRVSCNNKLVENDKEMKKYKTTLYFNDKEIKTIDTMSNMGNKTSIWDIEDEFNLSIIKDYEDNKLEYIVISVNSDSVSESYKNIFIVNKDGKLLGELGWTAAYGIGLKGKNENEYLNLETYGFKTREIIIYEPSYAHDELNSENEGLYKSVYTVRNGEMKKEIQKVTEVTGIISAGK